MRRSAVVFIVGPTAIGKTEAALLLGRQIPAEFISADSMQVYKGMDIVTDKPPLAFRRKYPFHLTDILSPTKEYNAADFNNAARAAIKKILAKRKLPVVVGGSGLYIEALLRGIFKGPGKDKELRVRMEAEAQAHGLEPLYERLKKIDPAAAEKIGPFNSRRILRALEVHEAAGEPISRLWQSREGMTGEYEVFLFGLRRDRYDLYDRIDRRVDFMVNAGLLDEVRSLLKKKLSVTASCCIGIRELKGFFDGRLGFGEAVRLIKRNSRRYAKRQMTWFRRYEDIVWFDLSPDENMENVARLMAEKIKAARPDEPSTA